MSAVLALPEVRRRARSRPSIELIVSGALIAALAVVSVVACFSLGDAANGDAGNRLLSFGQNGHLLGTDSQGRDMLARLIAGAGPTLFVGIVPVAVATVVGVALGVFAGLSGRFPQALVMRTLDVFFAFPAVLLAIAIAAAIGQGTGSVILALSVVLVPPVARVAEIETARVRGLDFIEYAVATGASRAGIAFGQVLPVIAAPVLVYATSLAGLSIVYAAGMSFLGLGASPPSPEWGLMISELRSSIFVKPELALAPAVAITLVAVLFNVFGNALATHYGQKGTRS